MNQSDAFSIVADPDRRRILRTLLENDGRTTVESLSKRLAFHRHASPGGVNEFRRTKIRLLHDHLPRLQDHGVIDYDRESGEVELDTVAELEPYVTAASA